MRSRRDSCPCWLAQKETPLGPSRWDPRVAYRLPGPVVLPSVRYVVAATGLLPQFGRDRWPLRGFAPPKRPDTMRSARRAAATVPVFVARPGPAVGLSAPAGGLGAAPPVPPNPTAPWATQNTHKAENTKTDLRSF